MKFIGLDLETTGSDIDAGALPIEIGIAAGYSVADQMSELIGWPEGMHWDLEAAEIHQIDQTAVIAAKSVVEVDAMAAEFLTTRGIGRHEAILVGWNVGSFDFPFVKRYLPVTAELCSYRFVDLNSVVFSMAESHRRKFPELQVPGYKSWKKRAKNMCEEEMGSSAWHSAGYDATASLVAWRWLLSRMEVR